MQDGLCIPASSWFRTEPEEGKEKTAFILFLHGASHMLETGLGGGSGERREKSQLIF